ncbi:hypothetical protein THAOC_16496 [Thalassiosira oceanica]|uniref:Uncharacterized protein n=1 Tax=Thalassiosira oceanica TaxID=159749 RepID=K0SPE6_THAOC|nr:hypothetical protein THAOC_16496 [Thalassiosira oceanica]|eukprot:EJK62876.1 hypothetical protein THAOC_16496 [Thalassiosira oceanica]
MAPFFDESSWEDESDDSLASVTKPQHLLKLDGSTLLPTFAPGSGSCMTGNASTPSASTTTMCSAPKGILRRADRPSPPISSSDSAMQMPAHWPSTPPTRRSVSFPAQPVTEVRERERTNIIDVPSLFYSAREIRQFKRDFREVIRKARSRNTSPSEDTVATPTTPTENTQPHDNSFWRSKVAGRWSLSSSRVVPQPEEDKSALSSDQSIEQALDIDPLNDGSSIGLVSGELSGGMFSSVFDVAREVAGVLNGVTAAPSSRCFYQSDNLSSQSATTLIVDTLYIF